MKQKQVEVKKEADLKYEEREKEFTKQMEEMKLEYQKA